MGEKRIQTIKLNSWITNTKIVLDRVKYIPVKHVLIWLPSLLQCGRGWPQNLPLCAVYYIVWSVLAPKPPPLPSQWLNDLWVLNNTDRILDLHNQTIISSVYRGGSKTHLYNFFYSYTLYMIEPFSDSGSFVQIIWK